MDFNGIGTSYSAYETKNVSAKSTNDKKADSTDKSSEKSVYSEISASYEPSSSTSKLTSATDRKAIIAQLKSDTEQRMAQMQSLVTKMFAKQGITIGTADDMWKALANGNFTADADTIAQAKEDISEDGYWGVNQTSDRLLDFAVALSGGDEENMKKMVSAVEKGFKEATKSWGKDLLSISNDTYSATMKKFDQWFSDNGYSTKTSDILGNN